MKGDKKVSYTFEAKETVALLKQLVEIPSPSGYTKEIMDFMENILKATASYLYSDK